MMAKQSAIFIYIFLFSVLSAQKYSSFECGSSDLDYIPDQVSSLNLPLNVERSDYNIDLALHVIYGKYDYTDITVSVQRTSTMVVPRLLCMIYFQSTGSWMTLSILLSQTRP